MTTVLDSLNLNGYVLVRADAKSTSTLDIAASLGVISEIQGIAKLQILVPRERQAGLSPSYGETFGREEFPLHTDMAHWYVPPRYLLLRCMSPVRSVSTKVLQSEVLFAGEDTVEIERAVFRPRRRLDGRLTSLRLFDNGLYRWDSIFLIPMTNVAVRLKLRIQEKLNSLTPDLIALDTSLDCLIIDNWRALHGRTVVPESEMNRVVERVYLDRITA